MNRILIACFILAGCGESEPPRPSADESAQLDEAEDLLNETADESVTANRP